MIVYMLLNRIELRCYIGQTEGTLADRLARHWESVRSGSTTLIHNAMRLWDEPELWEATELQRCSSADQLDMAEAWWIHECSSHLSGVGYNSNEGQPSDRTRAKLTEDQRDFYRECGKRGAKVSAGRAPWKEKRTSPLAGMTPEQRKVYFSEAGKRGWEKRQEGKAKRKRQG